MKVRKLSFCSAELQPILSKDSAKRAQYNRYLFKKNVQEHQTQLEEAQKLLDYWNAVKAEHERVKAEEVPKQEETSENQSEQHSDNTKHSLFDNRKTDSGEVEPLSDGDVSAITEVSDYMGQKLSVVDSAVDSEGRRNNGLYDPNTGTIIVARDAQQPMGFVFGHEATHAVRNMSEDAYTDLHDAVRDAMGEDKWNAEVAYKKQLHEKNGIKLTDDGAAEEVVSDYVGSIVNQGENLKKLAYRLKHPVLSKIRESLTKLLYFFRGKKMTAEEKQVQGMLDTITEAMRKAKVDGKRNGKQVKHSIFDPRFEKGGENELSPEERLGAEVMNETLKKAIGDDSVLIDGEVGQRVLDDANNRGLDVREHKVYHGCGADFDKSDLIRFFRTKDGVAYGFTVGGKVYIGPRVATAETPIHEYSHLWATAMQKGNPKEWNNIVKLMKGTSVWDDVRKTYPELKNDSDIADEVLAHYSGRRGAERLREKMREIANGKGSPLDKADAMNALHKVKAALNKFWKGVADFLGIHFTTAEEVADRVIKDLLDGVDPRRFGENEGIRFQKDTDLLFHDEETKRLPVQEYAKLDRAIHTHNDFKNGIVKGEFTDNNYYLYTHHRDGSFDIEDGFPIVGNEEIIKKLQDGIKEGTIRNAKDIARFAKELQINRDGDNSSNVDAERGSRRNGGFDSLDLSRETDGRPSNESMGEGISGLSPEEIHSGGRIENIEEEAAKIVDSIFDYDIANSVYALRGQFRDYNTKELLDHIMYNVEHRQPKGWVENNRYAVEIIRKCIEARKRELDGKPARYPKRKDFIRRGKPLFRLKDGTFIKPGSYFSGGGLLEEGLKRYLDPSVAVEFNEKISGVYADNFGNHIVTADVRDVDPRELAKHVDGEVQYLHKIGCGSAQHSSKLDVLHSPCTIFTRISCLQELFAC